MVYYLLWAIPFTIMFLSELAYIFDELKKDSCDYKNIIIMLALATIPIVNIILLIVYLWCIVLEIRGIKK